MPKKKRGEHQMILFPENGLDRTFSEDEAVVDRRNGSDGLANVNNERGTFANGKTTEEQRVNMIKKWKLAENSGQISHLLNTARSTE
jgi:hypothetical protein